MIEFDTSISKKAGMSPGTLVHVGDDEAVETSVTIVDYTKSNLEERVVETIDDVINYKKTNSITWVDIEGLKNIELIESIGLAFNIHPLVLEDILNTHQRSKFEEYEDYLYIVLKGLTLEEGVFSVHHEQISILVLHDFVFTFREQRGDLFLPLKNRLRNSKGRLRSLGADYLTYAIMDMIVDMSFEIIDSIDEQLVTIEEELFADPDTSTLVKIQRMKSELIYIRRAIAPMREMLTAIIRSESELIHEKTLIYIRDVYDHAMRIAESIELYRDMLSGLLDIYISSVSNKMNEVMKVLTLFASIFIPLTFIAGIYGMNFENMPELKMKWAYPMVWVSFIAFPVALVLFFKKKKWL